MKVAAASTGTRYASREKVIKWHMHTPTKIMWHCGRVTNVSGASSDKAGFGSPLACSLFFLNESLLASRQYCPTQIRSRLHCCTKLAKVELIDRFF
jgi:hypothetical protein